MSAAVLQYTYTAVKYDMTNTYQKLINILKRELVILWIFSVLAGLALIILQNKSWLPLGKGDFVFLAIIALLVALYKPRWVFFLFISFIPFENIILASGFLPIQLRPYQFLGGILIAAVIILWIFKKIKFKLSQPGWFDWLIFSLIPFSFLALLNAPNKAISLKNNLILVSFVVLYYLTRNFIRSRDDLLKTAFFFVGSYFVVTAYGFYQVFADKFLAYRQAGGARSFEVMFGRPNSTFTEPDWLGIYLCFALAVFLSLIFYLTYSKQKTFVSKKYILSILDVLVFLDITLVILTLSRSAWIGASVIIIFYLFALMPTHKPTIAGKYGNGWKVFSREAAIIVFLILISLAAIRIGKLSKFDIFDRARSAATSEQEITIACESGANVPQLITNTNELPKYGCRYINLEEIGSYKSQGMFVTEIFRKDPNVLTRNAIYRKSWEILREHPLLGVGFGTITQVLGTDERRAGLNESNIFLQVWAGSGILGLIAFIVVIGYVFIYTFRRVSPICPMNKIIGCPIVKDDFEKTLNVFAVLGILALIIPNLFNAGLFMGIFWLGLAIIVSIQSAIRSN